MPIGASVTVGSMARTGPGSGRSFGDAENARLRAIAERMLRECDGNQRRLAERLGVRQPTVSNFLAGKTGAGVQLASAIATHAGVTLQGAVGGDDTAATPRWRDLPGWQDEERKAREMFPRVRPIAFDRLGNLMGERPPERVGADHRTARVDLGQHLERRGPRRSHHRQREARDGRTGRRGDGRDPAATRGPRARRASAATARRARPDTPAEAAAEAVARVAIAIRQELQCAGVLDDSERKPLRRPRRHWLSVTPRAPSQRSPRGLTVRPWDQGRRASGSGQRPWASTPKSTATRAES